MIYASLTPGSSSAVCSVTASVCPAARAAPFSAPSDRTIVDTRASACCVTIWLWAIDSGMAVATNVRRLAAITAIVIRSGRPALFAALPVTLAGFAADRPSVPARPPAAAPAGRANTAGRGNIVVLSPPPGPAGAWGHCGIDGGAGGGYASGRPYAGSGAGA